ncbi:hypothetical protein V6N12_063125 [Hibiscus sabdariffa]|uniref:Uncharacterized protein n=1 Tax=Hibiscus sabdariffa TaxID=183260 RepID=A0ABR2FAX2_9ROSI
MTSEGVLLYRSDEHISSHIDDGQIDEQRIRRRGQKIKEPSKNIEYYLQVPIEFPLAGRWRHKLRNAGVCGDRVLRQFNYHQPIPRPPPARQHIHSAYRGRFNENWTVKQANLISVWEERHTRWAEDLSPLQESDFQFNTEYYSWYLENGKPFLVSVEAGNKWREDPRCSKHRQLTSEFGQSFEEPTDDPYDEPNFDRSRVWPSSWDSVEEQPSSDNVWNSGEEQPPMYGGGSSSQPAYTDDGGYIPQMDYTSITDSSYHPEQMYGTPPSMQVGDQWFNDEQTPDQPRRIVRSPKRYDQTSSLHRQELPRRKQK